MVIIKMEKPKSDIFKSWLEIIGNLKEKVVIETTRKNKKYNTPEERKIAMNKARREYYKRNKTKEIEYAINYYKKRRGIDDQ